MRQQVGERYELERLLGSGSFSSVCQALDTLTGERVRSHVGQWDAIISSPLHFMVSPLK